MFRFCAALIVGSPFWATICFAVEPVEYDYMLNCQGCHLADGRGYPARGIPSLQNHMGKFLHVDGGREFLARVPGVAMSDLDDERLAAVLNWMLLRFSADELPSDFSPYTPSEIASLRSSPLTDVTGKRRELVLMIDQLTPSGGAN